MRSCSIDHRNLKLNLTNKNIFKSVSCKKVQEPLIEEDIIFLQNTFLENGFHNLKVDDINSGRSIVAKVLNSLNCYNDIAILNSHGKNLESYYNITRALIDEYELENKQIKLTNFFLDQFYFDFLIIELTQELSSCAWIENFKQHILDFNFHKTMPIIILTYENN